MGEGWTVSRCREDESVGRWVNGDSQGADPMRQVGCSGEKREVGSR
jgi:hypothetical protein